MKWFVGRAATRAVVARKRTDLDLGEFAVNGDDAVETGLAVADVDAGAGALAGGFNVGSGLADDDLHFWGV